MKNGQLISGAHCQFARNKLGITQAQLAKAVNVSRSQIANFETKGERFTPSDEVRAKLRAYLESQDEALAGELAEMERDAGAERQDSGLPAVGSQQMKYINRLGAAGCFRMSAELSEAQRDRLLAEIDKVREALEETADAPAKRGFFEPYDQETDDLIEKADALVKKFGFLCIVAFGYGFISLPTRSLLDRKRNPATIADALALKYADAFRSIGIRKNESGHGDAEDETEAVDAKNKKKRAAVIIEA